jgi:hypothetical protein
VSAPVTWVGSRGHDLFFFYLGSTGMAVAAGLLAIAAPALVVPLWLGWLALVDGPHLAATYTRTYLDPRMRREHPRLLVGSLLWFLPAPLALAAGRQVFDLVLLGATIWAFHHAVRQHHGVLSILQRHARADVRRRRADTLFLQLTLWVLFVMFLALHPWNRKLVGISVETPGWLVPLALGVAGAAIVAYAIWVLARGGDLRPGLFVLGPAVGVTAFGLGLVGAYEPLVPGVVDPEQAFLAVAFVTGTVHGVQYLGVVTAANRRRGLARGWILLGLAVACALYLVLNLVRMPATTTNARVFLAVYWGFFFHHYFLDAKIWHPGRDRQVAADLGLT